MMSSAAQRYNSTAAISQGLRPSRPRFPAGRKIINGVGAGQAAGMDQAHEQVPDLGTF